MNPVLLADAVFSEAYRFLRNRMTVAWSVLFVPIVGLLLGIAGQMFLKQKMGEIANARLPPGILAGGPLNLGHALLGVAGELANPMVVLFVMIGAATIYAGDYRWETWRLISARNSRFNLILGKVGVVKLLALSALLIALAFGFLGEVAKGFIHERPLTFTLADGDAGRLPLLFLVAYVRVVQVSLLGLLAAVVTRSLLATLFVPIVVSIAQAFSEKLILPVIGWEPTSWQALATMPGLAADVLKAAIQGGMGAPPSGAAWIAAISLLAWCLVPLAAALAVFQKQDLSKE